MIGVFLTRRRREFLEFVSNNPIDYQEILDPTDTNSFSLYTAIFSDGSALGAESFSVIDISTADFSEVFAPYIKQHKPTKIYPEELFYSALFYYYEQTQCNCAQTFIPPAQDNRATFENKKADLVIHKVANEKQDEELSSLVDAVEDKPLEYTPVEEPVQKEEDIAEESQESSYTEVFPDLSEENVQPEAPPQYYQQQEVPPQYYQQPVPQPPPPPPPQPQMYGYPYQQPPQRYGTYQQPPYQQVSLNPFGAPIQQDYEYDQAMSPVIPQAHRNTQIRATGAVQVRRRGTGTRKRVGAPIITFSSLTDKAGTTTVAYLLAKAMAPKDLNTKILYLDLNISNPNTISNLLGFSDTGASIINIATATEIDFASNLSLLTDTIPVGDSSFSIITFGDATFRQKTAFSTIDYNQFLGTLADNFDIIFVDIGKLQGTMPYQQFILNSTSAKHILVADGSTTRSVNTFISNAQGLLHSFEIVVNKSAPNVGTFAFNRTMHITPLAAIGYHNNTTRFITDAMPFEGTALQNELCNLGGAL